VPEATSLRSASSRDDYVDVRRYLVALRRNVPLIVGIVIVLTGGVIAFSLLASKTYTSEAQIIVDINNNALGSSDAATEQRQLATIRTLVESPNVLDRAARATNRTRSQLEEAISSTLDQDANVITITGADGTANGAAQITNAVARTFLSQEADIERQRLRRAQASLQEEIRQLQAQPETTDTREQIQALQTRAAELRVGEVSAGSELQLARAADVPEAASSPRPLRNAVLALFVSLFIAILAALARDQLWPRISDQRELGQLLDLPVLAGLPETGGRLRLRRAAALRRVEQEAYQTLSASIRLALPPDREHVILTTSALHAEGKTSVTARLGRVLAQNGHPTLLVSADLRWPRLDALLGVETQPGLSDLLATALSGEPIGAEDVRRLLVAGGTREGRGPTVADVLPAGTRTGDGAAALLAGDGLGVLFDAITDLGYTYVLVDAPPLLGVGDSQVLASYCDELLVVSRLERVTVSTVIDLRDMIDRTRVHPLGLVVIGARSEASPYYAGIRESGLDALTAR
jgi:Mrp family chromosome partitioning ATPase/capsular polysaccharide biosynthesis protein